MTFSHGLSLSALERLTEFLEGTYSFLDDFVLAEVSAFGDGWETDLYRLHIRGASDGTPYDETLVLRLYKGADPVRKAKKEHRLMLEAPKFGVLAPRLDALVTDPSVLGHPFVVMEHIPGGTLHEQVRRTEASNWLETMGDTLARIHALPWKELIGSPSGPVPQPTTPESFVEDQLESMDELVDQYNLADFTPTLNWLRERATQGYTVTPVFAHNDFHPQNILMKDGEMVVIDWSFADVSDHRMDLAWTTMLLSVMTGPEHRAGFMRAYERASGANVEHLEYFEALKFSLRMLTIATWLDETIEIPVAGISKEAIRGDYKIHVLNPYKRLKEITGLEITTIEEL